MPPFRLEFFKPKADRKNLRMLYKKQEYNDAIKVEGWQNQFDEKPFDTDPYSPDNLNYFLSHYKQFSDNDDIDFTTTTSEMSKGLFKQKMTEISRETVNYCSYRDNMATLRGGDQSFGLATNDYRTTMQKDYKCPYPYVMKRMTFPETPFLQYRRLKLTSYPDLSINKFYDDNFNQETCQLIQLKSHIIR